ncbi:MAG TPA: pro-sigmaK processing inhibitor BofA family protein [Syntrophomonas sp.]|mgnify:FL=1|nr:pro-sigmaK processing inhibitor BofA family protein [Syntrophomonas sp.]HRW12682.1 pro-sigmaK processing inhibitor BofA family protein [Syntrophomonas sp.]
MATANLVMAILFLLFIVFIIAQLIMKPLKLIWKLVINSVIGLALLVLTNYVGAYFDFSLPLNVLTVLIAGFLGIPGILLLICFQLLL